MSKATENATRPTAIISREALSKAKTSKIVNINTLETIHTNENLYSRLIACFCIPRFLQLVTNFTNGGFLIGVTLPVGGLPINGQIQFG